MVTNPIHRSARVALGCTRVVNPPSHDNMSISADYDEDGWPRGLEEPLSTIAWRSHEDEGWFTGILDRLEMRDAGF